MPGAWLMLLVKWWDRRKAMLSARCYAIAFIFINSHVPPLRKIRRFSAVDLCPIILKLNRWVRCQIKNLNMFCFCLSHSRNPRVIFFCSYFIYDLYRSKSSQWIDLSDEFLEKYLFKNDSEQCVWASGSIISSNCFCKWRKPELGWSVKIIITKTDELWEILYIFKW